MELIKFIQEYSDEQKCKMLFKTYRDKVGIICKKCGHKEHYWQQSIDQYECKGCGFRTTLRSGTLLEASKLPYSYWVITIFLMSIAKKSFSALQIQHLLGHKRYEPVWFMMQKIRVAMGNRDSKYKLDGQVELDDAFIETVKTGSKPKETKSKRGRGSSKQAKVMVMAKLESGKTSGQAITRGKKNRSFRYVKMQVVNDLSSDSINDVLRNKVTKKSSLITDGWTGYQKLNTIVKKHHYYTIPSKLADKVLPWVHTMIANVKRNILGNHHWVSDTYLQNYLNEFCYKTNRRYYGSKLWERLLVAAVEDAWYGKIIYVSG